MGALAFGVGSSELVHALATQTMVQRKPKRFRANFEGKLQPGVTPKDMILHLIGEVGTAAGTGHAVEYAGSAIRSLPVEGRLTVCNLSIEMGARTGMVAPDDITYEYLAGRDYAPKGAMWDRAVAHWRTLPSDTDVEFDREHTIDMAKVAPQITWGTSPEQVIAVDRAVPDPSTGPEEKRAAWAAALQYQGLEPGKPIEGTKVDWVFIGSCTNSRISDLRAAAAIAKGRHKADHVTAWIVPGSERVKREAEAEGLDKVFLEAGFEWREPGCSMCIASNGERVPPGQRSVSTSNRNFVGRQGPGARTHLASPAMAAAAAIKGAIADVRKL
jgi:3-isopropylmalate/(R)-2-methylmalate dehydratase large subunit